MDKRSFLIGRNKLRLIFMLCLYVCVYICYTYPLICDFDEVFLGSGDSHISIFNVTHMKQVLAGDSDFFYTNLQMAPEGGSMILHTANWTMSFFASFFTSEELGINIFLMLSYAFSGFGAYLFAKRFLKNDVFSFLAGLIFAFSSYKMTRLGCHYNLVLTGAVPFLMIYWDRIRVITQEFKKWVISKSLFKDLIVFGLLFLFCLFSDFVVTISFLYFAFFYFVFGFVRAFYLKLKWRKWVKVLVVLVVFVCLDQLALVLDVLNFEDKNAMEYSADLLSLFMPVKNNWFSFESLASFHEQCIGYRATSHEFVVFLGFCLIALSVLAIVLSRKVKYDPSMMRLVFVTVMFFLLMMPNVRVGGSHLVYSPTAFVHFIPFVNHMRTPIRMVYVFEFLLSMIVFYTLLNSTFSTFFNKCLVSISIVFVFFLELWPYKYNHNFRVETDDYYHYLNSKPMGNVLIYPFGLADGLSARGEFDLEELSKIRFHNKSILGGHLSRIPDETFSAIDDNNFLKSLIYEESPHFLESSSSFNQMNIDYVVIDNDYLTDEKIIYLQRFLTRHGFEGTILKDGAVWSR